MAMNAILSHIRAFVHTEYAQQPYVMAPNSLSKAKA